MPGSSLYPRDGTEILARDAHRHAARADVEYPRFEGENFDVMEDIARRVPLSKIPRPAWDLKQLTAHGLQAEADEEVWQRVWSEEEKISFASTPMFLVRGRK